MLIGFNENDTDQDFDDHDAVRWKVLCKIIVWKEAAAHLSKSCSSAKNWQMLKMEVMDVFTLGDGDEYIWNKIKALL